MLNKIQYVPWNIKIDIMFNSMTYRDDYDLKKVNYNQEFSSVSQYEDYFCKTKVGSSLFNINENKLPIMFPYNCI